MWVPVKWILLTEQNQVSSERHYTNALEFQWMLSKGTKTGMRFHTGVEWERENNMHSHTIAEVLASEVEYFNKRFNSKGFTKYWSHRKMDVLDYEFGYDTFGYTMRKHNPMPIHIICPKRLACCRNGSCIHTVGENL